MGGDPGKEFLQVADIWLKGSESVARTMEDARAVKMARLKAAGQLSYIEKLEPMRMESGLNWCSELSMDTASAKARPRIFG